MSGDDTLTSKTKLKERMDSLQQLGIDLTKLSDSQLDQFSLSEDLLEALRFARTIKSNGALRRHYQYIGKLMRLVDEAYVREKLLIVMGESHYNIKVQHECESWRDRLLASDDELNAFISKYAHADITELRQLIRNVRKEIIAGKNKHYRALFQLIRRQVTSQEVR